MKKKTDKGSKAAAFTGQFAGLNKYTEMLIALALSEDVGGGDITTAAIVPGSLGGEAVIIAKEDMVVAGQYAARLVFANVDRKIEYKQLASDGGFVKKGKMLAAVSGPLASILTGERVALNFLQRLSGIATLTSRFVKAAGPRGARILDTRKTTPGMRLLERYAVKMGGGVNHRFGLFDAVLIKDNHIMAAGSVAEALKRAAAAHDEDMLIEVEVTDTDELKQAIAGRADIIMLDNMTVAQVKKSVRLIKAANKSVLVEVSGGVNLKNAGSYARTGADFISVGALTHSAAAVDISMEVERCAQKQTRKRR